MNVFMSDYFGDSTETETKPKKKPEVKTKDFPNPEFNQHCQNENQILEREYKKFLEKMRLSTRKDIENFIEDDYGYKNKKLLERNNRTISQLKEALNKKLGTCLPINNIFDLETFKTMIRFQKENHLKVDALFGDNSQKILFDTNLNLPLHTKTEAERGNEKFKKQTVIATAYYGPVKGQKRYVTGSYKGDVRLQGAGKLTASGKKPVPGIISAPPKYKFGTKVILPEEVAKKSGASERIVSVEDRGGAIKGNRIDIFFGYGEEAMRRAQEFGKKHISIEIENIG